MVLASTEKVVLGSIAFAIFWVLAVFPTVPFLPIGRTAGALLGAMLMVIFKVITPDEAYKAIDLPILGLLFGTMVVSIYLERADMFKYLGILVSWKSKGAKDLLCRICIISAVSSAFFTNDTSCVVLTEFVLKIASQNNIPPHPFLLALASSANIGSAATPIGNPQNLVIAIQSGISFGGFLLGILPAMVVGVFVNALILISMYWRLLFIEKDSENALDQMISEEDATSHRFTPATMSRISSWNSQELNSLSEPMTAWSSPNLNVSTGHEETLTNQINLSATMSHISSWNSQELNSLSERMTARCSPNLNVSTGHEETLTNQINLSESDMHGASIVVVESTRNSSASKEEMGSDKFVLQLKEENLPSRRSKRIVLSGRLRRMNVSEDGISVCSQEERPNLAKRRKRLLWKAGIYLVTIGMLIAFLVGLNMSWTALTAALTLVVIDFQDARLCLEKVSYSLLVFFCGMFISVEGFTRTGIPGSLWSLMEPHAQINHVSGIVVLALVILILSNVASNVPTVLLLGARVATSAAALSPGEEKKAWLILAWVSTVAGNLSLLGSAANLIVCEQARNSQSFGYNLSFWKHLKFGIPSTLIVTAIGLALIRG